MGSFLVRSNNRWGDFIVHKKLTLFLYVIKSSTYPAGMTYGSHLNDSFSGEEASWPSILPLFSFGVDLSVLDPCGFAPGGIFEVVESAVATTELKAASCEGDADPSFGVDRDTCTGCANSPSFFRALILDGAAVNISELELGPSGFGSSNWPRRSIASSGRGGRPLPLPAIVLGSMITRLSYCSFLPSLAHMGARGPRGNPGGAGLGDLDVIPATDPGGSLDPFPALGGCFTPPGIISMPGRCRSGGLIGAIPMKCPGDKTCCAARPFGTMEARRGKPLAPNRPPNSLQQG